MDSKKIICLCLFGLLSAGVGVGAYYGSEKFIAKNASSSSLVCGSPDYSHCYLGFFSKHNGVDSYLSGYLKDDGERSFEFEFNYSNTSNSVSGLSSDYIWGDFGAFIKSCGKSAHGTNLNDLSNWNVTLNDKNDCSTIPFNFLNQWGAYAVGFGALDSKGDKSAFPVVHDYEIIPTCAGEGSSK